MRHPARHLHASGLPPDALLPGLFHVERILWPPRVVEGKERWLRVTLLLFQFGKIDASAKDSWRRAGLQALELDPGFKQAPGKGFCAEVPSRPPSFLFWPTCMRPRRKVPVVMTIVWPMKSMSRFVRRLRQR